MADNKITRYCLNCGDALKRPDVKTCSRKCQFERWNKLIPERFMALVLKTETCWLWNGNTFDDWGYGEWPKVGWDRRTHRMSWQIHNGPIPEGMKVLHHCDNPPCVNPEHLFLGTNKDNHDDMVKKGRRKEHYGTDHGLAKLTDEKVRAMRQLRAEGIPYKKLGAMFGVGGTTAHKVIIGATWKHVV